MQTTTSSSIAASRAGAGGGAGVVGFIGAQGRAFGFSFNGEEGTGLDASEGSDGRSVGSMKVAPVIIAT